MALAGIHVSDLPSLDYQEHLFRERTLTSVTANTRQDGEEVLALAARLGIRSTVTTYGFDQAPAEPWTISPGAGLPASPILAGSRQQRSDVMPCADSAPSR